MSPAEAFSALIEACSKYLYFTTTIQQGRMATSGESETAGLEALESAFNDFVAVCAESPTDPPSEKPEDPPAE